MIYIEDVVVAGKHGVHPHEKQHAQRFRVSVELDVDTSVAEISDDLADTVNWSWLRDTITDVVENKSFNLIERLAREIANRLLTEPRINSVVVAVDKLDAFRSGVPGVKIEVSREIK